MTDRPLARSPIEQAGPVEMVRDWEVSRRKTSAPLRLADLTPMTKIGVKATGTCLRCRIWQVDSDRETGS